MAKDEIRKERGQISNFRQSTLIAQPSKEAIRVYLGIKK